MRNLIILITVLTPLISDAYNLVGGKYSNVGDVATARVRGATAAWINPAGLAHEKSSSISSGASAYTYYFNNTDGRRTFSTSSSTSHVSAVKSLDKYIFSFLLYTSFNQSTEDSRSSFDTNSEGYLNATNSTDRWDINQNIYIFAFAPRFASWGLALNFIQTATQISVSENSHNYSSDYTKRFNKTSTMQISDQKFLVNLNLGQQFRISKNMKFGYKIQSPTYLVSGSGRFKYNSIQVEGKGSNDSSIHQINYDAKTKSVYDVTGEAARVGLAYYYKKYTFEFDIHHSSGYTKEKSIYEGNLDSAYWLSSLDYYVEQTGDLDQGFGDQEHNSISLGWSLGYDFNDKDSMGFGIRYVPTEKRGGTGTNDLIVSGGFSNKYKNFIGSYGLSIMKGLDTGKNSTYDETLKREVKTKHEYEIISIIMSGAYYF